jgi:hypothetical protein
MSPKAKAALPVRKLNIRRIGESTSVEELVDVKILGIDIEDEGDLVPGEPVPPFWQPATAEDVDKLVAAQQMRVDYWKERAAIAAYNASRATDRREQIIRVYSGILLAVTCVPEGKTFAKWRGPWTLGHYRNQPNRALQFKVTDLAAAAAAKLTAIKVVLDTELCNIAIGALRTVGQPVVLPGVEITAQEPISFSPPTEAALAKANKGTQE